MTARATLADRRISSVERAYGVSVKGGSASCTVWRKRSAIALDFRRVFNGLRIPHTIVTQYFLWSAAHLRAQDRPIDHRKRHQGLRACEGTHTRHAEPLTVPVVGPRSR